MKNYSNPFEYMILQSRSFYKLAVAGILINICSIVQAQSPTTPALDFNVFVKNNARLLSNQTEGPVAMGGNFSLEGNYVIAAKSGGTFKSGNVLIGLVVGDKVIYSSGNQNYVNNGYVKAGDGTGSTVWYKDNNSSNTNLA